MVARSDAVHATDRDVLHPTTGAELLSENRGVRSRPCQVAHPRPANMAGSMDSVPAQISILIAAVH